MNINIKSPKIRPSELIKSFSKALDLVNPAISNHHLKVATIASNLCREMKIEPSDTNEIVLAAALHDIGAVSQQERTSLLGFELDSPHQHSETGYKLLRMYAPFIKSADIVRFHHLPWQNGAGRNFKGNIVPLGSHIIHFADRLAVLVGDHIDVLMQIKNISNLLLESSNRLFMPEVVEAFTKLSKNESFWLDALFPTDIVIPDHYFEEKEANDFLLLAKFFARIIDFRSKFTANHSSGVAASASILAKYANFSKTECRMIEIAGYLHDLGKLALPTEILEKKGRLTNAEFSLVKSHTYHTYRILAPIEAMHTINVWASLHHERMDGHGYPFHYDENELPLGSRIVAVADVFTALLEERPYRTGMSKNAAISEIVNMVNERALDPDIVSVLIDNFDEINDRRLDAQFESDSQYGEFSSETEEVLV